MIAAPTLVSRPSDLRCAFCFDDLDGDHLPQPCAGCGTRTHPGCRAQLKACPTLGCPVAAEERRPSKLVQRVSTALSALILGGSFVWLAALLLGATYALLSNSNDQLAPELFLLVY